MNLKKRISQLRSLQSLASKEAIEIQRLMLEKQQQRNNAVAKLQGFQSTYNTVIQAHNKSLSGSQPVNPHLLSNTQLYLDKLQRDIDTVRQVIGVADADILKYENILLKLLAKQKGYQKITDNYAQDLRVTNEKRVYLDSARESSVTKTILP